MTPPHWGGTVRIERYYDGAWRLVTTRNAVDQGLYSAC